jgi:hypothetical protein
LRQVCWEKYRILLALLAIDPLVMLVGSNLATISQKSEVKPFSELTSLLINRNFSDIGKVLLKLIQ